MKSYTQVEVDNAIFQDNERIEFAFGLDDKKQLIISTGLFKWNDGSWHDEPES